MPFKKKLQVFNAISGILCNFAAENELLINKN